MRNHATQSDAKGAVHRAAAALCWATFAVALASTLVDWGAELAVTERESIFGTLSGPTEELHLAAMDGDLLHLQRLLSQNPKEVDPPDPDGKTPLRLAAEGGHYHIMLLLLDAGADLGRRALDGLAPAHVAAGSKKSAVFFSALERRRHLDHPSWIDLPAPGPPSYAGAANEGWTPLHWAIHSGNAVGARILVAMGADILVPDANGRTPLHAAAERLEVPLEFLRLRAVDLNPLDANGETPLHASARAGNVAAAKALVHAGASLNIANHDGLTPEQLAKASGYHDFMRLATEPLSVRPREVPRAAPSAPSPTRKSLPARRHP